ncbi:COG2102: Predicted ATPases of PP-loop superfamily [hydrothermal vent metagenome]|uniref:COG2102: Predicted ATPases of PP-loop superfamily n=1 Tax=hydrothermal vent metagenome TaxID=652676 RepID=A0A3B1DW07_9ZZZZ
MQKAVGCRRSFAGEEKLKKEPVIFCWSGGKDSAMALYRIQQENRYHVVALLTTVTHDYDRISMHGVRRSLLHQQAESLGIPLDEVFITKGANNNEYENRMGEAFQKHHQAGIQKVVFGDIFLEDLKEYRERQLEKHDLQCLFPLWKQETLGLAQEFIAVGFRAVTCCIDPRKLSESFAGKVIDEKFLSDLPADVDPCGENGEFHSFVFDGPIFQKAIQIQVGKTVLRDSFFFCDLQ